MKKFFRGALYVFIALFPFVLYEGYLFNGTATRSINTVIFVEIIALLFGIGLLTNRENRLSFFRSPVTLSLGLLLVVLFISSLTGVDFQTSFWSKATRTAGLFYFIHCALLYCLFWVAFDKENDLRTFIKVFLVSAGLFSVASVFGQEGTKWLFASKPWEGLTIGNSTFAGMYLYSAFMLSVYYVFTLSNDSKKWWKYFLPAIFVLNPYLVNFDIFRGAANILENPLSVVGSAQASSLTLFFSIIILAFFLLISKIKRPKIRQIILFTSVGVGLILFSLGVQSLLTQGGKVQELYLKQASATRPIMWQFSKQAISERPLFGWGGDNFDRVFQEYYPATILELKNGGEAWLDRAHNIFVDQTIESGYVGMSVYLIVYLVLIGCLLYVIVRSKNQKDIIFATILLVYFAGHMLELQTAFDTTITYVPLVFFSVMTGHLFQKTRKIEFPKKSNDINLPIFGQYSFGVFLVGVSIFLFCVGTVPIMKSQAANGNIRRVGSSEKRALLYPVLFSSPLDPGAFLWRTSNDIQRGVSLSPKMIEDQKSRDALKVEIEVIVSEYEKYLQNHPDDYRAILNLADMYIYQRLFDVNNLEKAQKVLDHAIVLVPQSPQPYWMKSVAYLYQAKFKEARESAKSGFDLNPGIEESTRVIEYIDESIKNFPEISLYSFKQI